MAASKSQASQDVVLMIVKVALFVFILASPFVDFKSFMFLNNTFVKIFLLVAIVLACFVDFQLALIATIAFMILIIHMNTNILMQTGKNTVDKFENKPDSLLDEQFGTPSKIPDHIDQTQNIVCTNNQKNDMNEDLIGHYIDDKIKPYDVFIQMLTSKEQLSKVQGALI